MKIDFYRIKQGNNDLSVYCEELERSMAELASNGVLISPVDARDED